MRFDLTDLRLFLNVVDAGTLTGGAERTHMTLASASERIRNMESALGAPLLVRRQRGVHVTEAGSTMLHHARMVLDQIARMQDEMSTHGTGLKARVRLLCNTSAMSEHLPAVLGAFLARYPNVSIDLQERSSQAIVDAVRAGLCDIGIVSDAVATDGLVTRVFRRDELDVVVAVAHALAKRRRVTFADIVDSGFIGLGDDSPLQQHIAQHAMHLGKRLNYRVRVGGFETLCRMVEQGVGIGIVPRTAALRCRQSMKIARAPLADAWAVRRLLTCVRNPEDLTVNAKRMLRQLLERSDA